MPVGLDIDGLRQIPYQIAPIHLTHCFFMVIEYNAYLGGGRGLVYAQKGRNVATERNLDAVDRTRLRSSAYLS
jgi:hypothetical protein